MLSGIGTIVGAVAIILAAILGRVAVASVRRQKQVERQIEHAEKALTAAYQLQAAASTIRSPLSTSTELSSSREELEATEWFDRLTEGQKDRTVQSNIFYQRIRHFEDVYNSALAVRPFVKAYFGDEADEAFRKLIHARQSVRVYADAYARDEGHDPKFSRKIESYIWEGAVVNGEDPIASEVGNAIKILESKLLPVIREGHDPRR